MKSVTKTFQKDSDIGELMDWFYDKIPTEDREVIYSGAEPSMTVEVSLKNKVRITVSIEEGEALTNQ